MKRILLITMPFGALERQALGISLFKSRLNNMGIGCEIKYFNMVFARLAGVDDYSWVTNEAPHTAFVGEWIFTKSLYNTPDTYEWSYINSVIKGIWDMDDNSLKRILKLRNLCEPFLNHCMEITDWNQYSLVGFTSTFEQNIASLALAKRIKSVSPGIKIVFGGANWEGEMGIELHTRFPFVDFAFSGEADDSFPALIGLLKKRQGRPETYKNIPGLVYRERGESVSGGPSKPVKNLDELPVPDYSDYFAEVRNLSLNAYIVPTLLYESSRGCWWGAKHHCMFCGLNGSNLTFRSKSSDRILAEIDELSGKWKTGMLQAVDNVICMDYFKDLFPKLSLREHKPLLFYEIRANLNRDHIKILSEAGIKNVQPGIESLNNNILRIMNKGTTFLQNIQVLKWCREFGINASWNLLYGFPSEKESDYLEMFEVIKKIWFLGPPAACGPVRLDRFSPYFNNQSYFEFKNVRPLLPYRYLYPFGEYSLKRIACYFDYNYEFSLELKKMHEQLSWTVRKWQKETDTGSLQYFARNGELIIIDSRNNAILRNATLSGIDKEVYLFCDSYQTVEAIERNLNYINPKIPSDRNKIITFLNALLKCGYMISDGKSYLSLALDSTLMKQYC